MAARPRRIAVFGGSFNPIHAGHLVVAEEAAEQLGLDRVVFVPAGEPPHKERAGLAPASARLEMVKAAIAGNPRFSASDVEIRRAGRSFTVDTLEHFRSRLPRGTRLFLVIGEDSAADLPGWREPRRILEMAEVVVATRPGARRGAMSGLRRLLPRGRRIERVPVRMDISATELRRRIAAGGSVRYLVPDPARRVIERRRLYRGGAR